VKICGTRTLAGAQAAVDAGADLLGFILYPPARRYVPPDQVALILRQLRGRSTVRAVGVFVDQDVAHIAAVADRCGLDLIQLSGDEAAELTRALSRPVVKTFRPASAADLPDFPAYRLHAALLEAPGRGWGGNGRLTDWSIARAVQRSAARPLVFLAGGLHAGNVGDAIAAVQPDGVDVSSGVETGGVQDPERIAAFVAAAKGQRP